MGPCSSLGRGSLFCVERKAMNEQNEIPALLDECEGLLFVSGELIEATMEAQAEVRELRARVAELEASHRRLRRGGVMKCPHGHPID